MAHYCFPLGPGMAALGGSSTLARMDVWPKRISDNSNPNPNLNLNTKAQKPFWEKKRHFSGKSPKTALGSANWKKLKTAYQPPNICQQQERAKGIRTYYTASARARAYPGAQQIFKIRQALGLGLSTPSAP